MYRATVWILSGSPFNEGTGPPSFFFFFCKNYRKLLNIQQYSQKIILYSHCCLLLVYYFGEKKCIACFCILKKLVLVTSEVTFSETNEMTAYC